MKLYNFAYDWAPRVETLTRRLVAVPSVVGTPGEIDCARVIHEWLKQLPYFHAHPDHLLLQRTTNDPHERYNVLALVRGSGAPADGAPTCVLMGHFDTVDIQDYGSLTPLACSPDELARATGLDPDYMCGRGSLDMKSGLAAHMAVLERFAAGEGPQDRCLLFAATPDEEDGSHGILSVVEGLPELTARWGLSLQGAINTDYTAPRYEGDPARYIYAGTIGKLLPSLFVAGAETHVGEPFSGFDPNWLAAEVTRRVDYNPDLCEEALGEVTPPPVSLKLTDRKEFYTVQTAAAAWAYFNWFTLLLSPAEVLERFRTVVAEAFGELAAELKSRAAQYTRRVGSPTRLVAVDPRVYTYAELSAHVARQQPDFERETAERLMQEPGLDLRAFSCRMTEELWRVAGLPAPAAVVGFAQVYSPPLCLSQEAPLMQSALSAAHSVGEETGLDLQVRNFFPYISDMSFLGCPDSPQALAALRGNSPGWGYHYKVDHEAHARLNLPVINIGPWGEGAHSRTERVEKSYAFGVVPELVWRTIQGG